MRRAEPDEEALFFEQFPPPPTFPNVNHRWATDLFWMIKKNWMKNA